MFVGFRPYGLAVPLVRRPATATADHIEEIEGELQMRKLIVNFVKDQSGATAIEYGLIAAGISVAIIVAVNGLGTNLNGTFSNINTQLR